MPNNIGTKNLNAQDATVELHLSSDFNGAVGIWVSGTGTIILEFGSPRNASTAPFAPVDEWKQIKMFNPIVGVNAAVDSLVVAGAQIYGYANCVGLNRVRARRTDSGVDDCFVSIGAGKSGICLLYTS